MIIKNIYKPKAITNSKRIYKSNFNKDRKEQNSGFSWLRFISISTTKAAYKIYFLKRLAAVAFYKTILIFCY